MRFLVAGVHHLRNLAYHELYRHSPADSLKEQDKPLIEHNLRNCPRRSFAAILLLLNLLIGGCAGSGQDADRDETVDPDAAVALEGDQPRWVRATGHGTRWTERGLQP